MTGARISLSINDKAAMASLRRLRGLAVWPAPLLRAIGVGMVRDTDQRLGGAVGPDYQARPAVNPASKPVAMGRSLRTPGNPPHGRRADSRGSSGTPRQFRRR